MSYLNRGIDDRVSVIPNEAESQLRLFFCAKNPHYQHLTVKSLRNSAGNKNFTFLLTLSPPPCYILSVTGPKVPKDKPI